MNQAKLEENEYAMKFFDMNIGSNMLEKLRIQRDAGEFCDVLLKFNEINYKAHVNVLASCSPYFHSLFLEKRCDENVHIVSCGTVSSFEAWINYIYSGVVIVCYENVDGLLALSNRYLLIELASYCAEFLRTTLSINTCVMIRAIAEKFGLYELSSNALSVLTKNIKYILQSQDILNYGELQLKALLHCPDILTVENKVETLFRWLTYKPVDRLGLFRSLLMSLNTASINVEMIIPFIRNCESFYNQLNDLRIFFCILKDAGMDHDYIKNGIEYCYEKLLGAVDVDLRAFDKDSLIRFMNKLNDDQKLFSVIRWTLSFPTERLKCLKSLLCHIDFHKVDVDLFTPYLKSNEKEIRTISLYDWQQFYCALKEAGFHHDYVIDNIREALIKITEMQGYNISKFNSEDIFKKINADKYLSNDRKLQIIVKWIIVDVPNHVKYFGLLLGCVNRREISENSLINLISGVECMFKKENDLFTFCETLWAAGYFYPYLKAKMESIAGSNFSVDNISVLTTNIARAVPSESDVITSVDKYQNADSKGFVDLKPVLDNTASNNTLPAEATAVLDLSASDKTVESPSKVEADTQKDSCIDNEDNDSGHVDLKSEKPDCSNQSIVLKIKTSIMKEEKLLKKASKIRRRKTKIPMQYKEKIDAEKKLMSVDTELDDPDYDYEQDLETEKIFSALEVDDSAAKGKSNATGKPGGTNETKHPKGRKPVYQCNICLSYATTDPCKLELHIARSHKDNFTFTCNLCSYETKWNKDFYIHMKTHISGPPFKCDFPPCEYKSDRIQPLLYHRMKHTDERPHACEHCAMKFRTRSNLVIHMRCHTGERPFGCKLCDKTFSQKGTLEQHMASHSTTKSFLCDVCGFATKYQSHLKAHNRLHTGNVYRCEFPDCNYVTPRPSLLRAHNRSHTGSREFICGHCGKAFIEKSHLVRHEKLHTKDKSFKCQSCDYATYRSDKLKEHVSKHHSGGQTIRRVNKSKEIRQSEQIFLPTCFSSYPTVSLTNVNLPPISVGGQFSKQTLDVTNLANAHIIPNVLYDETQPVDVVGQQLNLATCKIGMIQEDPRGGTSTGIQYVLDPKLAESIQPQDLYNTQGESLGMGSIVALL